METDIMEIISDMEFFIGMNWTAFKSYMMEKGFTDKDVEIMGEKLEEYLEEKRYR